MKELTKDQYKLAAASLRDVTINNLFARSVVEHHVDGKIYVDNVVKPKSFYVLHPYGMSLLYGEISDSFLQSELKDYLLRSDGLRVSDESLQVFPTGLESRVDEILGKNLCTADTDIKRDYSECKVIKHKRVNFKFNPRTFEKLLSTIKLSQYSFKNIDDSLFNETKGSVVPGKFWNNASDFAASGIGFSLEYGGQTVAVAFSSFIHEGVLELGMETKAEFRRKGFASIISAKLITYCLEKNLEPIWACRLGNQGSYNLAIKLGFEPVAHLPYYELL